MKNTRWNFLTVYDMNIGILSVHHYLSNSFWHMVDTPKINVKISETLVDIKGMHLQKLIEILLYIIKFSYLHVTYNFSNYFPK